MADASTKSRRGGKRPGAGRKPKGHASASLVAGLDLAAATAAPPPDEIETTAQIHAKAALDALVLQLTHGKSEPARIKAADAILDRGYGKPSVDLGGELLPFLGTAPSHAIPKEIREAARLHAHLAIKALHKIAAHGESESARVAAAKSMLDRGLGTVAVAKVPDGPRRPEGKKEQLSQAARETAVGRYQTPPPPVHRTH